MPVWNTRSFLTGELADAARGEVRHAAVRELDARGGDVDVAREHAKAAGAHVGSTGARASATARSRSWIIRSSITSTSAPRA